MGLWMFTLTAQNQQLKGCSFGTMINERLIEYSYSVSHTTDGMIHIQLLMRI